MEKPTNKTLALVLAFAPMASIILYIFFALLFALNIDPQSNGNEIPDGLIEMLASLGLLVVVSLVSMIYFVIHAIQNPRLDSDYKLIWTLANFFGGTIGHVIYYFLVIQKEKDEDFKSRTF